jgi:hypothetical protein
MFQDNVTIILQGIFSDEVNIFTTIDLYIKYAHVILSIYDTPSQKVIADQISEKYSSVLIVYNNLDTFKKEYFDKTNTHIEPQNTFYQIKTTLSAIDKSSTEYIVKSRVDHFYSNIYDFIQVGLSTEKILITSNWIRNARYRFHASDCLLMSNRHIVQNIFLDSESGFYTKSYDYIPEVLIWMPYLKKKALNQGTDIESDRNYISFMVNTFIIFNILNHKEYRLKTSWAGVITKILEDPNKNDEDFWRIGCICGHKNNETCKGCPE